MRSVDLDAFSLKMYICARGSEKLMMTFAVLHSFGAVKKFL